MRGGTTPQLRGPVWLPVSGDTCQRALLHLRIPLLHLLDGVLPLPQQLLPLLVGLPEVLRRLLQTDLWGEKMESNIGSNERSVNFLHSAGKRCRYY